MQLSSFPRRAAGLCLLLAAAGAAAGFALGRTAAPPAPLQEAAFLAPSAAPSTAGAVSGAVSGRPDSEAPPPASSTLPPMVCLTFDDGPSRTTSAVLEVLAAEEVPATFFVVANESNERYLPLIRQAQQAGHEIALHSASHRYSDIYRSTGAFWADIELLRQRIAPYADAAAIACLRFPGGSTNTVSRKYGGDAIMQDLKAQAEARGWRWVDWNVSAEDAAGKKLSAEEICRNVTRGSEGRDRCIVLMHDSATTGTTAEALPAIIRWYKENGYAFCTVTQLYDALE